MEVYYKFKSAKDYDSISIDWHYTTASDVIDYVLEKKCSGKRSKANYDNLTLTNADTNQVYLNGETLIPKNSYLIISRAPRLYCSPIVVQPEENELEGVVPAKESIYDGSVSLCKEMSPSTVVVPDMVALPSKADEDQKIKDLIDASFALDWRQCHNSAVSFAGGRGFRRGGMMGGRSGGRGFGQGGFSNRITPPAGYICHRCKVSGHFIQHCPTNGDSTFDIKRTKPLTGIPSSMLKASPNGSYALPGGVVSEVKPNEATFEKSIQGIPSTRSVAKLPPELYCPLCREVMKDAILVSKCYFKSFCDKCIRDYIMSKSLCFCGVLNVLADDLLPNKTPRSTIVRYLESSNSSGANSGSCFQPQDMESTQPNIPPSTKAEEITAPVEPVEADNIAHEALGKVTVEKGVEVSNVAHVCSSAPPNGVVLSPKSEENTNVEEITEPVEPVDADIVAHETLGKVTVGEGVKVSKAAHECLSEPLPRRCPPLTDEEMQQKPISGEVQNKRRKLADMQPRPHQDFVDMRVESSSHNHYWNCMQPEYHGFGQQYCGQMPFMGYGLGPTSILYGDVYSYNPYRAQGYMMPIPPQRDLGQTGTGSNGGGGLPILNTRELNAPKTTIKQKQDHEKSRGSMKGSRDRDFNRCMITKEDATSVKSDFKLSPERSTYNTEVMHTSSKRKGTHDVDYYEDHPPLPLKKVSSKSSTETMSDRKHKANVLARITFPEVQTLVLKKRKLGYSSHSAVNWSSHQRSHNMSSNEYQEEQCKTTAVVWKNRYNYADDHIYESGDDDRHFKRRPSRYESSPAPAVVKGKQSNRSWREKGITTSTISRLSAY